MNKKNSGGEAAASSQTPKGKKDANYTGTGLCVGLSLGVAYGLIFNNLALGISIGTCLGLCFGTAIKKKS